MKPKELKNIIKILLMFVGIFQSHAVKIDKFDEFLENINLNDDISMSKLKNKIIEELCFDLRKEG
ncbi:MAG: hypothetical protein KH321_03200 [Clostridium sp.]|nr:hypothetical protein [Clostridium sp.]